MEVLSRILPDPGAILDLTQASLGNLILEAIRRSPSPRGHYHRDQLRFGAANQRDDDRMTRALTAGWEWMRAQQVLIPVHQDWMELSNYGRRLLHEHTFALGALPGPVPRELLHELVIEHALPNYYQMRYDEAVLSACRRLEIRVREASRLPNALVGVQLMRQAFDTNNGALRNPALEQAEREAEAHLYAGVIGAYRNAIAHRDLAMNENEAMQVLVLVSLLLKIIDIRP